MQHKFINENGVEVTAGIGTSPDGLVSLALVTPTDTTSWDITEREFDALYNLMHIHAGYHDRMRFT